MNKLDQSGPAARRPLKSLARLRARTVVGRGPGSSWLAFAPIAVCLVALIAALVHASLTATPALSIQSSLKARALKPLPAPLRVGSVAPDFVLRDIHGARYSLVAQRGHPLVLEFFAVWSRASRFEGRVLSRLARQDVPKGVRVWSILANPYRRRVPEAASGKRPRVRDADLDSFAASFQQHYHQLIDPRFTVVNEYAVRWYPVTYVVSRHGLVTYVAVGRQPYRVLAARVRAALRAA